MINRKIFFDEVRWSLFSGSLTQSQVLNIDRIITEYEIRKMDSLSQLAYISGTVYHETDRTMQAIEEKGKGKGKDYGRKVKYDGKPYFLPDHIYFGRGHTQNTWYDVYETLTRLAKRQGKDWDFLNNPELLLQIEPSIWATFEGMTRGLYTGKKLSDYINTKDVDFKEARRIINRMDKAVLIAGYADKFLEALEKAKTD